MSGFTTSTHSSVASATPRFARRRTTVAAALDEVDGVLADPLDAAVRRAVVHDRDRHRIRRRRRQRREELGEEVARKVRDDDDPQAGTGAPLDGHRASTDSNTSRWPRAVASQVYRADRASPACPSRRRSAGSASRSARASARSPASGLRAYRTASPPTSERERRSVVRTAAPPSPRARGGRSPPRGRGTRRPRRRRAAPGPGRRGRTPAVALEASPAGPRRPARQRRPSPSAGQYQDGGRRHRRADLTEGLDERGHVLARLEGPEEGDVRLVRLEAEPLAQLVDLGGGRRPEAVVVDAVRHDGDARAVSVGVGGDLVPGRLARRDERVGEPTGRKVQPRKNRALTPTCSSGSLKNVASWKVTTFRGRRPMVETNGSV